MSKLVLLAALVFTAPRGGASETSVDLVGVAGRTLDDAVLIGRGGEIYRKDGDGFRRSAGGGVATSLVTARGASATEIWGLGADAPPYRYDGASWNASPFPMTGPAVMSKAGAWAVAVARRVMVLSQGKWTQLPTTGANGGILAVWASGPKDALVAAGDGELRRYDGAKWNVIKPALASTSERVRALYPAPSSQVLAAGDEGTLLLVSKTSATAVTAPATVTGFRAQVGANLTGKTTLAGPGTVAGKDRHVLLQLDAGKLVLVDTLPALAAGDELAALLPTSAGEFLVATRQGAVHLRSAAGAWTRASVDPTLPPTSHAANPPAPTR